MKYLKDTEANISNVLVMVRNLNIRDSSWNFSFPHYSVHSDLLNDIADFMDLYISRSTNQVSTRYLDNQNNLNLVINLMFFQPNLLELDNHMIYPEWRLSSDHILLTVDIVIIEEYVQTKKHTIVKNSEEKKKFLAELIETIKGLNIELISSKKVLKRIVQKFTDNTEKV